MTLPEKFKFLYRGFGIEFTAIIDGVEYVVSWDEGGKINSTRYLASDAAQHVHRRVWTIRPESFPQLINLSSSLQVLISEKKDATDLAYDEMASLKLTRGLINRLLDDRQ